MYLSDDVISSITALDTAFLVANSYPKRDESFQNLCYTLLEKQQPTKQQQKNQ